MSAEARVETVIPPETVVVFIAGMMAVAHVVAGAFYEDTGVAKKAWDIYDAVFAEADERYKESEDDEAEGGSTRNPGFDQA